MIAKIKENFYFEKISKLKDPSVVYNLDYVKYIINTLKNDINEFVEKKENIQLFYSCKANTNEEILKFISNHIDGYDVASKYEFHKVRDLTKSISFTSPYIDKETLLEIYEQNHIFDFNTISQLEKFISIVAGQNIGLRVNVNLDESNKTIFGEESRFGVRLPDNKLKMLFCENDLRITKLHIHTGEKSVSIVKNLITYLELLLLDPIFKNVEVIDIGGGLLNLYKNRTSIQEFWQQINEFCNRHTNLRVIIEPGNLLLAFCGYLVGSLEDIDFNEESSANLTLNISRHNIFTWNKPNLIYPPRSTEISSNTALCNINGCTCYELDYFCRNIVLDKKYLINGTKFIFGPVGAYVKANSKRLHDYLFPEELYFVEGKLMKRVENNGFVNKE